MAGDVVITGVFITFTLVLLSQRSDSEGELLSGSPQQSSSRDDALCGVFALRACLLSLGFNVSARMVQDELPNAGNNVTLLELKQAAESFGSASVAVQWSESRALQLPRGCVAVCPGVTAAQRQHFVAVVNAEGTQLLIDDHPQPPQWMFESQVRELYHWDGVALVLARRPEDLRTLIDPMRQRRLYLASAGIFAVCVIMAVLTRMRRPKSGSAVVSRQ